MHYPWHIANVAEEFSLRSEVPARHFLVERHERGENPKVLPKRFIELVTNMEKVGNFNEEREVEQHSEN